MLDNFIEGSGGGGKGRGSGGVPEPAPNTLRSRTRISMIEAISEGPIKGLKNGARSIFFNQTPFQNDNGSFNFENAQYRFDPGNADDGNFFMGARGVENIISVEAEINNTIAEAARTRTITEPTADAVRVIIRLNSLFRVDTETGAIKKNSVGYAIDIRTAGGSWTQAVFNDIREEKCTSPTQFAHRIELPQGGEPWQVRVRRTSPDETDDRNQSTLFFESYVVLIDGKFTYPNTACMEIKLDAESIGSSIPQRAYHVEGRLLLVPDNYDPVARTYAGIWTGNFKVAYSNNPAWCFYDMVTNDVFGVGDLVPASSVDKWMLYTIARHCDEMVPTGYKTPGGLDIYEPRYTFNGVIRTRKEAFFQLQAMATTWRGMNYWSLGRMFTTADMPSDPVRLMTPANVIDGEFNYSSTSQKSSSSVILVRWNDPDNFYNTAIEAYVDDEMIRKVGWREKTVDLEGCTSRGLARRYAKWIIETEKNETETVSFTASWDNIQTKPGDIILVADPRRAQVRLGGRIVSHTSTQIIMDHPFDPAGGETYQIRVTLPDGSIANENILSFDPTDLRKANISSSLSTFAQQDAMFVILGTDVQPRQYRVISVEETEENLFGVTALLHDPGKYARVEYGLNFDPPPLIRKINTAKPPENITLTETNFVRDGRHFTRITLGWTAPSAVAISRYLIHADTPLQAEALLGTTSNTSIDLDLTDIGDYTFKIRTVDLLGSVSEAAIYEHTVLGGEAMPVGVVSDLVLASSNTGGTVTFTGQDIPIKWKNSFPVSATPGAGFTTGASPLFVSNEIRVFATDTNELLRVDATATGSYTYDRARNLADCVALGRTTPTRGVRFEVRIIDVFGRVSSPATLTATNPPPAMFNPVVSVDGNLLVISWPVSPDPDFAATMVWVETNNSYNPLTTTPKFEGVGNSFTFIGDQTTTYHIRIGSYDIFGKAGMNISPVLTVVTGVNFDTTPPAAPSSAILTSTVNAFGEVILSANWGDNAEPDFAYYDVEINNGGGAFVGTITSQSIHQWIVRPNFSYTVRVRAVDKTGNKSAYTVSLPHTSARDTIAPDTPLGLSAEGGFGMIWLSWLPVADSDLSHYEIFESLTSSPAPSAGTAPTFTATGQTFVRENLPDNATRYYFLRSVDTSDNKSAWTAAAVGTTTSMGDASNLWRDFEFSDPTLLYSDLPTTFSIQRTTLAGIGARFVQIESTALAKSVLTEWQPCDPDTEYHAEGRVWVTPAGLGLSAELWIEFGTVGSDTAGTVTLTRQISLGSRTTDYDITTSRVDSSALIPVLRTSTTEKRFRFVVRKNAILGSARFGGLVLRRRLTSVLIADGAITANKVTTGELLTFSAQIKDAIVTNAKIFSLDASKITAGSILAGNIIVGVGGSTLSTIMSNAATGASDPASRINGGSTLLEPGKILISGGTTLNDWRSGGDNTKIDGGAISANSITANKLSIGSRNVSIEGLSFEHNSPSANSVSWTAGRISYLNDAGSVTSVNITAGSAPFLTTLIYLFWAKGGTTIQNTTNVATAMDSNNIVLATYGGGTLLIAEYGRTIIDGSFIKTGSISANQIAANAVTTDKLEATSVTAAKIAANAITADKIEAGAVTAEKIAVGSISADRFTSGSENNLIENTDFSQGLTGWVRTGNGGLLNQTSLGLRAAGFEWAGVNYPTLSLYQNGTATDGDVIVGSWKSYANGLTDNRTVPVEPGKWYSAGVRYSTHRCAGELKIAFYTRNNTYISEFGAPLLSGQFSDQFNPELWPAAFLNCQAPSNAAYAFFFVRKFRTLSGSGDSWIFLHKPQMNLSHEQATVSPPYGDRNVTVIDGATIRTGSITASQLTTTSAVITNTAQIANAVISNAQIQDLSVNTIKIAGAAVTTDRLGANAASNYGFATSGGDHYIGWGACHLWFEGFGTPLRIQMRCRARGSSANNTAEVSARMLFVVNGTTYASVGTTIYRDNQDILFSNQVIIGNFWGGLSMYLVFDGSITGNLQPIFSEASLDVLQMKR